jgi:hypothetical protein
MDNSCEIIESMTHDITQISVKENECLTKDFTESENFEAIKQMKKSKVPWPDGFPAEFYQTFWGGNKKGYVRYICEFSTRQATSFHLNFGTIILFPKKRNFYSNTTI